MDSPIHSFSFLPNNPCKQHIQMVIRDDLPNNQIRTDMQTSTSAASFLFRRKEFSGKEFQKFLIWIHVCRLLLTAFPDAGSLWYIIVLILQVLAAGFVVHIWRPTDCFNKHFNNVQ